MLQGKTVLLGVTGSIAAYKIAYLASALKKLHAQVHVLMTKNATNFINPITFESLTGNKCLVDTFDRNFQFQVEHVSIAKQADVVMMDPPRAGSSEKFLGSVARLSPQRVVYISCNPETLQRDLNILTAKGYRVKAIQPVDMFPHTEHIENIAVLERRSTR